MGSDFVAVKWGVPPDVMLASTLVGLDVGRGSDWEEASDQVLERIGLVDVLLQHFYNIQLILYK